MRTSWFLAALCVAFPALATLPTPDGVDMNLSTRANTLGAFEPIVGQDDGNVPYGLNGIIPAAADVRPVILPALGDACRLNYNCVTAPSACNYTFTGSETVAAVEAAIADTGNGPVFCIPSATNWTAAGFDIDISRDCSAGSRCWLVPSDIGSRTANAQFATSPTLNDLDLTSAQNWGIAALRFDNVSGNNTGDLVAVNTASDVVIAYNYFVNQGAATSAINTASLGVNNSDNVTVYENILENSAVTVGKQSIAIAMNGGSNGIVHRNTVSDHSGWLVQTLSTTSALKIVLNHFYQSGAYRVAITDTSPQGAGGYDCGPGGLRLSGTGHQVYGNLMHGFRPHSLACAGPAQEKGAVIVFELASQSIDVHSNAIWDSARGLVGSTTGATSGSTISANIVELVDGSEGAAWETAYFVDPANWPGNDQIYAFNTVLCSSLPAGGISVYAASSADFDMRYNLFRGCSAPEAQTGSISLLNVYTGTAENASVEPLASNCAADPITQSCDDTANAGQYTDFSIWSEICTHRADPQNCTVRAFLGIGPPEGGDADQDPTPTFTGGRGSSAPRQKWGDP